MSSPLTPHVATKDQVILPKPVRAHPHWAAGTRLIVEETDAGVLPRSAPMFPVTALVDVAGRLAVGATRLSLEEMDAGMAREAARRARLFDRVGIGA